MNIFKRTYTAEDVTKNMTAMMLVYLNEMQKCVERRQMSDALVKEKSMLQSLGLSNTKNAQLIADHEREIAQYNANIDCFKLMTEAWKLFGNDVMIVRYDQFMQLLEKYNLVCGDLSRYKGYIPEKNLHEIAKVKSMDVPGKFAVGLQELNMLNLDHKKSELVRTLRFPYNPSVISQDVFGKMRIPFESMNYRRYWSFEQMGRFFIAAPVQDMTPLDVRGYSRKMFMDEEREAMESISKFARFIQTKDPFFCSCTEYGVLIYSKWGDEAQDEIIKRYEQLSKTVNN